MRFQHVRAHIGVPGNETADALAKAAVEQAWMCGTTPVVLLYARDAYARAVSDGAGAGSGRPPNQTGDQTRFRQRDVQPEVRMVGVPYSWVLDEEKRFSARRAAVGDSVETGGRTQRA